MATVVRLPDDECPRPPAGAAVTVGAYDGVHRGHQAVIAELRQRARAQGLASAVITFDRHPAQVVRPESAPLQLTELDQEVELLAATGVDLVVVLTFDETRAKEPPEDFVREVLADCLNVKLVIVGSDFHFGHQRRGNVALLAELGAQLGFGVEGMALVGLDGAPAAEAGARVSSTAIRAALAAGDVAAANEMLGRPHEVRGTPAGGGTIKVAPTVQLPAEGSYLVEVAGREATAGVDGEALEIRLPAELADAAGERVAVRFLARVD